MYGAIPTSTTSHFLQESIYIVPHIILHLLTFTTIKFLTPTGETRVGEVLMMFL